MENVQNPDRLLEELEGMLAQWKEHKTVDDLDRVFDCIGGMLGQLKDLTLFDIRKVGDYIDDGVFICDKNGIIKYVNKANQELIGVTAEDCVGKHVSEMTTGYHINNTITLEILLSGKTQTAITWSEQTGVQLLETGAAIIGATGKSEGVIIVDKDISQTMQIAEALMTTQEKRMPLNEIREQYHDLIQHMNRQANDGIEWKSTSMKLLEEQIRYAAKSDATVLLSGKTGTGKEVAANRICSQSARNDRPFVKVNCAAIPDALIESELFGYAKGAFTGADPKGKPGAFELANGGTLMLDEIGELPMNFQAKLLRAIQEQTIRRVGGTEDIELDIRIIAATNRNLLEMVAEGSFREDLYYRLNVLPLKVPSLQERKEDIVNFVDHFLKIFNHKYRKNIVLDSSVYHGFEEYSWPGNIREMENTLERWCVVFDPYTTIKWKMVSHEFNMATDDGVVSEYENRTLQEIVDSVEGDVFAWGLEKYGSTRALAERLNVHHSTIVKKMQRFKAK